MIHIEKAVADSTGAALGVIKYAEAGALVPVGQMQYEVLLFTPEGEKNGELRKVRTTDVFVDWKGFKIRYPDDLAIKNAVTLAERIIKENPDDHEKLRDLINGFARSFYEGKSEEKGGGRF